MKSFLREIEEKFIDLEESLDDVGREDDDIDNDGDHDKSDEYLHHRRKVRKKAILQDDEDLDEQNITGAIWAAARLIRHKKRSWCIFQT